MKMIDLPYAHQVIYAFLASVMALILQHEDAVMRGGLIINLSMGILGRHGFSCHRTRFYLERLQGDSGGLIVRLG